MVTNIDKETMQTDLSTHSKLEQKDRIQILLSEYSHLCSEMRSRTSYEFQIVTVAAAVFTWFLQQPVTDRQYYFWLAMVPVFATFVISVFVHARDLKRAARRVRGTGARNK